MKKLLLVTLTGLALCVPLPAISQGDAAAGKGLVAVCAGCHGADGNSVNPDWPKIAGQHEKYLAKQLADYKSGKRKDPIMAPMAVALSEQDMSDIGAYYATLSIKPEVANEDYVKLGEAVYRGGNRATGVASCMGCHGPSGKGNPEAKFPMLAGQHAKYTANQLRAFRTSTRDNDAGKMMRNIAIRMTDAEIDAVSEFIAGLK